MSFVSKADMINREEKRDDEDTVIEMEERRNITERWSDRENSSSSSALQG